MATSKSTYQPKNDSDELNAQFLYSMIANDLLIAIVNGQIDPKELAAAELANRGFDNNGKWIGFKN